MRAKDICKNTGPAAILTSHTARRFIPIYTSSNEVVGHLRHLYPISTTCLHDSAGVQINLVHSLKISSSQIVKNTYFPPSTYKGNKQKITDKGDKPGQILRSYV